MAMERNLDPTALTRVDIDGLSPEGRGWGERIAVDQSIGRW